MGTSAATAGSSGTEAIFANPGAMGLQRGYLLEALGVTERRGGLTTSRFLGLAVIDAVSTPMATSFAYLRSTEGDRQGSIYALGFAGAFTERMHLGVQGRYLQLGGAEPIKAVTADAGLSWDATNLVTLGVSGFNLIQTGHPTTLPQVMGAGLAIGTDTFVRVMADWRGTFLPKGQIANRYAAGAGGLLGGVLALRAGWMRDEQLRASWWSAGIGLVTSDGFSLDAGYRQAIGTPGAREMALSLRYYPPQ